MSNLTIISNKREVDPVLLEHIEHLMEMIRSGDVSGLAMALTFHDGRTGSGYHAPNVALMLGSLEFLKQEIMYPPEEESH